MNAAQSVVNLPQKFELFRERWTPKIVAQSNGQLVKIAKFEGEFVWHTHAGEDELFLVVSGSVDIWLREGSQERCVTLGPGELFVVPKGVEHRPVSKAEAQVLMIEPASTRHTGDIEFPVTVAVEEQVWI